MFLVADSTGFSAEWLVSITELHKLWWLSKYGCCELLLLILVLSKLGNSEEFTRGGTKGVWIELDEGKVLIGKLSRSILAEGPVIVKTLALSWQWFCSDRCWVSNEADDTAVIETPPEWSSVLGVWPPILLWSICMTAPYEEEWLFTSTGVSKQFPLFPAPPMWLELTEALVELRLLVQVVTVTVAECILQSLYPNCVTAFNENCDVGRLEKHPAADDMVGWGPIWGNRGLGCDEGEGERLAKCKLQKFVKFQFTFHLTHYFLLVVVASLVFTSLLTSSSELAPLVVLLLLCVT